MYSRRRLVAITLLLVILTTALTPASAKTPVARPNLPTKPIPAVPPAARAAAGDWVGRVGVLGDIIYVAEGTHGLSVLRLHVDRFPPSAFVPLARH